MKLATAVVIADSISDQDIRITTFQLRYWRAIHAELMTHRCLVGDTKLVFDLPAGTTNSTYRKYEKTIKDFHDTWHNGSKERLPSRYQIKDTSLISPVLVYTAKELCKLVGYKSASNIRKECRDGNLITQNPNKCKSQDHLILGGDFIQFCNTPKTYQQNIQERLKSMSIRMLDTQSGEVTHTNITDIWLVGQKEIFELTAGKYSIRGTFDHPILTQVGWKNLADVSTEDSIVVVSNKQQDKTDPNKHKFIDGKWRSTWQIGKLKELCEKQDNTCTDCGNKSKLEIHHLKPVYLYPEHTFDSLNIVAICSACHKKAHSKQGWQEGNPLAASYQKVDSIINTGKLEDVYDLSVLNTEHNFVANDIIVHNCFSRNAGSSRARPSKAIIEQVAYDPWGPIIWGLNEPGMQANSVADIDVEMESLWSWRNAATRAANSATALLDLGLHKQIVNRVLEPFTYIDVVVTATDYANWFALRLDKDAQPEIQQLAQAMKDAMDASKPVFLKSGEWHLPYITDSDIASVSNYLVYLQDGYDSPSRRLDLLKKISAARCARTSYKAFDGKVASIDDDLALFNKLMLADLKHASPTEHQATPDRVNYWDGEPEYVTPWLHGNFRGWVQYRKTIPNEFIEG